MQQNNVLLEVKNLKTHFFTESGVVRAVDDVSFTIKKGQTLGLLGESGSGKSITGFSLLRLVKPPGRIVEGEILFHPQRNTQAGVIDLAKFDPYSEQMRKIRGSEIAMIFQEPMTSLDPLFSIGNQLTEAILIHEKIPKKAALDRAAELLDKVRLPQPRELLNRYPHQLSGGMRQRVMIAMALIGSPSLLIADEPTTALDVTTEGQILDLLRRLQEEFHMAMLFITHDLGVIAEMAEEVLIMYLGRVVEKTDIHTLFEAPKHPYTRALLGSMPKIGNKSKDALPLIKGMVPSPFAIPRGCHFHPRCAEFLPGICDAAEPPLIKVDETHQVRCFLYSDQVKGNSPHDGV